MTQTTDELTNIYIETVKTKGFTSTEAKVLRALASAIEEKRIAVEDRNAWYHKYHRLVEVIQKEIDG